MMDRRQVLRALGLTGVAASLSGLGLGQALAQGSMAAPKRLIVLSHCHGWPYEAWRLQPDGLDATAPWNIDLGGVSADRFSQVLAPLYPHRRRVVALDGLSLGTAELDMDGNRHDTGWVHAWTGDWADFSGVDTKANSASLDQLVAAHIARPDRLPSLEISIDDSAENGRPIAYAPSGSRLPVENAPERVWQRLFGPSLAPNPLLQRKGGSLSFAYGEYAALAPRLSAGQRIKMDAHFELLNRLSGRLEGMASASCEGVPERLESVPSYDERFDAFAELVAGAFACDLTRVVTLSLGELPTADFGWDHVTDDVHKGLAHGIYDDPQKHQAMADYLTMHTQQVARLVSLLESLPDADGNSVMDNTLIVWGSELADGWHGYEHYCPVFIGGDWHFQTGRYHHWPQETPIQVLSRTGLTETSGRPHQHALVSVAQAMGLDTDHIGIKHVQSQSGVRVDCTGPLPGLT